MSLSDEHPGYSGFRRHIRAVGVGRYGSREMSFEEAHAAMGAVLAREASDVQIGGFLISMRIKGETPGELAGVAQALRDLAGFEPGLETRPLVASAGAYCGVCNGPQLSLAAAVVAAACGAEVVVHCGDTLGPKSGTTPIDVLAALGGPAEPTLEESQAMLARCGVAVVHAGVALPGWRDLAQLRSDIGLRTPLHSAEKLVNWFGARRFVVGHSHAPYGERLIGALGILGADAALAVRGIEGSDCVRPGRPVVRSAHGLLDVPELLGATLRGDATPQDSARITRDVLEGCSEDAAAHAVATSAAVRIVAAGITADMRRAVGMAWDAIDDGTAMGRLTALLELAETRSTHSAHITDTE